MFRYFKKWYHFLRAQTLISLGAFCREHILGISLIIAPHPDDETFGCGMLIAKLSKKKIPFIVVIVSDGDASHAQCGRKHVLREISTQRKLDALKALEKLGCPNENVVFLDFPDGSLERMEGEVERYVDEIINRFNSQNNEGIAQIFVPSSFDAWEDHLAVTNIGMILGKKHKISVYYYCTWMYMYAPCQVIKSILVGDVTCINDKNYFLKKKQAIQHYLSSIACCGMPYIGLLPDFFLKFTRAHRELFFKGMVYED